MQQIKQKMQILHSQLIKSNTTTWRVLIDDSMSLLTHTSQLMKIDKHGGKIVWRMEIVDGHALRWPMTDLVFWFGLGSYSRSRRDWLHLGLSTQGHRRRWGRRGRGSTLAPAPRLVKQAAHAAAAAAASESGAREIKFSICMVDSAVALVALLLF